MSIPTKKSIMDKLNSTVQAESDAVKNKSSMIEDRFQVADKLLNSTITEMISTPMIKKKKAIRATFSLLQDDFDLIKTIIDRLWEQKIYINRSELIRSLLILADGMSDKELIQARDKIEKLKVGAPKKIK